METSPLTALKIVIFHTAVMKFVSKMILLAVLRIALVIYTAGMELSIILIAMVLLNNAMTEQTVA